MRYLFLLTTLIVIATQSVHSAETAIEVWAKRYNGPGNGNDAPGSTVVDNAGNIIVAGGSVGSNGTTDFVVAKYGAEDGSLLWEARYAGPNNLGGSAFFVTVDSADNVIATGHVYYTGEFGDIYTAKFRSTDGGKLWEKRYTGAGHRADLGRCAAVDQDDNVIVTGIVENTFSGLDFQDYYTAKYASANGALIWEKTYTRRSNSRDEACSVAVDGTGSAIVTGTSDGDYYTIKYNPAGAIAWAKRFNGPSRSSDEPIGVAVDSDGAAIVSGRSPSLGGGSDYYTIKYNSADGEVIWATRYNSPGNGPDLPTGLALDRAGNVVVTGVSSNGSSYDFYTAKYSSIDGGVLWERYYDGPVGSEDRGISVEVDAAGNVVVAGNSLNGDDNFDFYIAKYAAADGTVFWEQRYNGPDNLDDRLDGPHFPRRLAVLGDGSAVVSGSSMNSANLDFAIIRYASPTSETHVPTLFAPIPNSRSSGPLVITFKLPESALPGTVALSIGATVLHLSSAVETAGIHSLMIDPSEPGASSEVSYVEGGPIADGVYNVVLSYQNALGNSAAQTSSPNVTVDTLTLEPTLVAPAPNAKVRGPISIAFVLPETALPGTLKLSFGAHELTLAGSVESSGSHQFTFDPAEPDSASAVASGEAIPDGVYSVILSYRDILGNAAAQTLSTDVRVDTVTMPPVLASPSPGESFGRTVHLAFTLPEDAFPGSVTLSFGPHLISLASTDEGSGEHALTFDVTDPTGSEEVASGNPIPDGTYPVTLSYRDALGNPAATAGSLNVRVFSSPVHVEAIAIGGMVPGSGTNGIPEGAEWTQFGTPSLLGAGESVGFSAKVQSLEGTVNGLFAGPFSAPTLRARIGAPAPDASGGVGQVIFHHFKDPVFASAEHWAVIAKVQGKGVSDRNDTGIWAGEPNGVFEIAREGGLAPGASGARFKAFVSILRPGPESLVFTAKLAGAVSTVNDFGLWTWTPASGVVLQLRKGSPVASGLPEYTEPLTTFASLQAVSGSPGQGRHDGTSFSALLSFPGKQQVITNFTTAGVIDHVGTGTMLPSGVVGAKFGMPCWRPGANSYVVAATLEPGGGISAGNQRAVLRDGFVVAIQGMPAPVPGNAVFKSFLDPVAGVGVGDLAYDAFIAQLAGAKPDADTGIFRCAGFTPTLSLVAREGSEPPGAAGTRWTSFGSLSALSGRGALFTAKLSGRGITSGNDEGAWAEDSAGELRLLFREGETHFGKTLKRFAVLRVVNGSPGQRRAWHPDAAIPTIVWRAEFLDRSSAILTTQVP